jgi:hypothetical protein
MTTHLQRGSIVTRLETRNPSVERWEIVTLPNSGDVDLSSPTNYGDQQHDNSVLAISGS